MQSCKFSDPENEVDLVLSRAGIFETPKDIDDFTNCPTHRSNLDVWWNRSSSSRCRVPKEMSGHDKGRVMSIPKADRGISKRVSQIVLKMSRKFIQSGFGKGRVALERILANFVCMSNKPVTICLHK